MRTNNMKCIEKYADTTEKKVLTSICKSIISGTVSQDGEYNRRNMNPPKPSLLDVFTKSKGEPSTPKTYQASTHNVNDGDIEQTTTFSKDIFERSNKKGKKKSRLNQSL